MKTYIAPLYEKEDINTADIVLSSPEVASVSKVNRNNAEVTASVWDVLGWR